VVETDAGSPTDKNSGIFSFVHVHYTESLLATWHVDSKTALIIFSSS